MDKKIDLIELYEGIKKNDKESIKSFKEYFQPRCGIMYKYIASKYNKKYTFKVEIGENKIIKYALDYTINRIQDKNKEEIKNLEAYIYTTLYNQAASFYKTEKEILNKPDIVIKNCSHEEKMIEEEEHIEIDNRKQKLREALKTLKPIQREIIEYCHGFKKTIKGNKNMPLNEVSKRVGLSYDKTRQTYYHALRKLRLLID